MIIRSCAKGIAALIADERDMTQGAEVANGEVSTP